MAGRNDTQSLEQAKFGSMEDSVRFDRGSRPDTPEMTQHDPYRDASPSEESIPKHTQFLDLTNGSGGGRDEGYSGADVEEDSSPEGMRDGGSSSRLGSGVDPSTPGKVVETGQEHTGRWTREEHEAFLNALQTYGKEWKKVAAKVKTRTVVQTRTHAQKYFQKLQKVMSSGDKKGEITQVEMGVAADVKKASVQKKKRQQRQQSQTNASTHAAAHLVTNLSATPAHSSTPHQAMTNNTSNSFASVPAHPSGHFPAPHGFSTPSSSTVRQEQPLRPPHALASFQTSGGFFSGATDGWNAMKIKAPEPDLAAKHGRFPEPSPAACGKRKLAEIAAARMLAGVAASSDSTSSGKPPLLSSALEGDVTPPPFTEFGGSAKDLSVAKVSDAARPEKMGVSLQIVNPETLGMDTSTHERRRALDGSASPTTPWDGQLKALVSEAKSKEAIKASKADDFDELFDEKESLNAGYFPATFPHAVCGPGTSFGRSALHKAICEMDLAAVRNAVSSTEVVNGDRSVIVGQCDEAGYYPVHSASSLRMIEFDHSTRPAEIMRILLAAGADAACTDAQGNTPLHWAARAGDEEIANILLMKNCPPDVQNDRGETPLHWAMRVGRTGMRVVRVLLENGARASIFNKEFKRPLDVAADGFTEVKEKGMSRVGSTSDLSRASEKSRKSNRSEQRKLFLEKVEEKRETRANLLLLSAQSRTLVLHHPECLEHIPKTESDWEVPDRVNSIMRRIMPARDSTEATGIFPHEVTVSSEFDRATLDFLSRVHSAEYLAFVNDLSKDLERKRKLALLEGKEDTNDVSDSSLSATPGVVPFTPMVQRTIMKGDVVKQGIHSDTAFSAGSLRAARRAAGAVHHAVDRVLVGRNRNAFCVVRPPGHHAGIKGLLDGGESCGFCIFNNVAAGAMHAISDERLICERCAIVDIDVHHGNGTEEIVKKCHDPARLLFFSIHLYDHDRRRSSGGYKFYPGTGNEDDVAHNIINVPIVPLWKEKDPSGSGTGPTSPPQSHHNTRRKAKEMAAAAASTESFGGDDSSEAGANALSQESNKASDTESESRSTAPRSSRVPTPSPSPRSLMGTGRQAYRRAIQHRLIPALRAFNPDLILISAGFDAAKGDVGNAKHMALGKERMGLDLSPEDYAWTTRKILEVADICCQGRVVSVLEGGYGRTPVAPGDTPMDGRLDKAVFSECAIRHLEAMIDPYDAENRFSSP